MSFTYEIFQDETEAQDAREFPLLPIGEYEFTIVEAKKRVSQAGNDMIELKHKIYHDNRDWFVFGYLIGTKKMSWLVKHFCEATQLEFEYLNNLFNEDLANHKSGIVSIGVDPARAKNDGSGQYWKAKNIILDYIKPKDNLFHANAAIQRNMINKNTKKEPEIVDDDLPF